MNRSFVTNTASDQDIGTSEDLAIFHAEQARTGVIDVWTHRAMLMRLGRLPEEPTIVDVGCSAGYFLQDLRHAVPKAMLVGVDLAPEGLRKAQENVPDAKFLQGDACALPLQAESADVAVCINVLEHVVNDELALAEMFRISRPGARALVVVPHGPHIYDCFDRYVGHVRRYEKHELARKAMDAGFEVLEDLYLGAPLYPVFWMVKQRNRRHYDDLQGDELRARVDHNVASAQNSKLGYLGCRIEEWMLARNIRLPFGIRGLTVLTRPASQGTDGAA